MHAWKYLVFLSPSFTHLHLDLCLKRDSFIFVKSQNSSVNSLLLARSKSPTPSSSSKMSILFISSTILSNLPLTSSPFTLAHSLISPLILFNFSFTTYPPHPTMFALSHFSLIILQKFLLSNHQFLNLKGFGPQSTSDCFKIIGQ